ncbi:MAG: hypothetical protein MJK04_07935 [Psychrosphaera sp.]|nr:hypothetical protein [Psychrosphaera sp.]
MKKFLMSVLLVCSFGANATVFVDVDDASKLLWQITPTGHVYFRNLNEFNSAHAACCYAYRLDITTPVGSIMWSTILAKMAAHKKISLGFPGIGSNDNKQSMTHIGRHLH